MKLDFPGMGFPKEADISFCQGGRGWLAFGERKIIPQSFRRPRIFKFSQQKRRFLQLRKYWLFLAVIIIVVVML